MSKPLENRQQEGAVARRVVLWTTLLVGAMLFIFLGATIAGVLRTGSVVKEFDEMAISDETVVERLGGPEEAVAMLSRYLSCPVLVAPRRKAAISVLGACGASGEKAVPVLVRFLHSDDTEIRFASVIALCRMGPYAKGALPDLMSLAGVPDPETRTDTLLALVKVGGGGDAAVRNIIEKSLTDSAPSVRAGAARALGQLGSDDSIVRDIEKLLADAEPVVRRSAIMALSEMRPTTPAVVNALKKALADKAPEVQAKASEALQSLGVGGVPAPGTVPEPVQRN